MRIIRTVAEMQKLHREICGPVVRIPDQDAHGLRQKIPHIGWNSLELPSKKENWNGTILEGIETGEAVYFVHSFTAVPINLSNRLADTYYNRQIISAAVQSDRKSVV